MADLIATILGARINVLREADQLTQANLAALSLKSVETISNFERGKTIPSVSMLHEFARHLGCSVADFFGDEAEDPLATSIASKTRLIDDRDRTLLVGFVDLLVANGRR